MRRPDGSLWSVEGIDDGPAASTDPIGAVWPEGNLLVYVDVNRRRRILQLVDRGSTVRPHNSFFIDPSEWLWIAKSAAPTNRKMGIFHADHSDNSYNDHHNYSDQSAHSDSVHYDWPRYTDRITWSDHSNSSWHDNEAHFNWADYMDSPHGNLSHLDSHGDSTSYDNEPHGDWSDQMAHGNWSDHENYSDDPYDDRPYSDWHGDSPYIDRPYNDIWMDVWSGDPVPM